MIRTQQYKHQDNDTWTWSYNLSRLLKKMTDWNANHPMNQVVPSSNSLPLHGIEVIDLSRLYPGPLCSQLLADLGSNVIKVEDEQSGGDPSRFYPPKMKSTDSSFVFHCFNRNKKSITLDLKKMSDVNKLKQLLIGSRIRDELRVKVMVESSRPGKLEQLLRVGDVRELWNDNPALIICRVSSFGQSVPNYSDIPGQ